MPSIVQEMSDTELKQEYKRMKEKYSDTQLERMKMEALLDLHDEMKKRGLV